MRRVSIAGGAGWRLAIGALAAVVLLAVPVRADVPPQPVLGPYGEREVTVFNRSPRPMNELYVSSESAEEWGQDRLGEHTLEPGESLRVRLGRTRECMFDVKVVYDDASREETRGVNLCRVRQVSFDASTATAPPEAGAEQKVVLVNHAARPIQPVDLSPVAANQWGDDRLGETSISVGEQRVVLWRGECSVDLRVVFDNRAAEERRGLDLCETPALSIEPGWTTADKLPAPVLK